MLDADYIYENLEELLSQEQKAEFPLALNVKSAEDSFLIDENNTYFLDLTSNLDTQPFGYSFGLNNEDSFVSQSGLFNLNAEQDLKISLKNITGFDNIYLKNSISDCYSEISRNLNISENGKILVSGSCFSTEYFHSFKNIDFVPLNNTSILKSVFTKNVHAFFIETTQLSDAITLATNDYLEFAKELCIKHNAKLIFDFSGSSIFRTGKGIFNIDKLPDADALIISRGLANGYPLSCLCVNEQLSEYGKKSIPVAGINTAFQVLNNNTAIDTAQTIEKLSGMFLEKLSSLAKDTEKISNLTIHGLLITFNTNFSAYNLQKKLFEKQIIVHAISDNKLLLTPSYSTKENDVEHFLNTLKEILESFN